MALYLHFFPLHPLKNLSSSSSSPSFLLLQQKMVNFHPINCASSPSRRTANYQPTIWDDSYIQAMSIDFMDEKCIYRREKLKAEVRCLIGQQHSFIEQLELVDTICQLGLDYHFDLEIKDLLSSINASMKNKNNLIDNNSLHGSALLFRLLREHDITNATIPRVDDLITCIKEERESFNPNHQHYVKGMLSLYEASYLDVEGEEELYELGKFAKEHLRRIDRYLLSPQLVEEIDYALELPLHWRMSRLHTRRFIDAYGERENVNPTLLELAKLDFNMVQSIHKTELQEMSRWWRNIDLVCDELNFARDRLVENYLWALGFTFQPKFWRIRKAITKIICLSTIIDDIYDVYGTLDELKLFTKAIEEWKMDAAQQLPYYMKKLFIALFNTMNDIASTFSMEKQLDILPCFKGVWADLCKALLVEAKWYYNGYTPTLDEYLENAWITIAGICPLIASYCLSDDLTAEDLKSFELYRPIIRNSCMLLRLYDDLGTTTVEIQRGDVLKSIQCYMNEKNISELAARNYIRCLIRNYWKRLNTECTSFSGYMESFEKSLVNMPRTAQCFYQYGDGYGEPSCKTKEWINCLIIEPISL